jgi:hypothetical protein
MFNPESFLDQVITEANDTVQVPVPAGEYMALVKSIKAATWQSKDGTKSGLKLEVVWDIQDPAVLTLLDRTSATCRQSIMLDVTEACGLDMGKGKNIGLGKLRTAVNMNAPGQPFSPSQLVGQCARVTVEHRIHNDAIFAEVKAVAPM